MTTKVKTLHAHVQCDLGWDYPDAFVAIRHASGLLRQTLLSDDCISDYVSENEINTLVYRANFWKDEETYVRLAAKNSKPLVNKVGDNPDLFEVDLNSSESISVRNGPLTGDDELLELIRVDIVSRSR